MSRFAVIFRFCTILAAKQKIITSRGEHRGPNLIFMPFKHSSPSLGLKISENTLKFQFKFDQKR
jgi:hypothetical protein